MLAAVVAPSALLATAQGAIQGLQGLDDQTAVKQLEEPQGDIASSVSSGYLI